MKKIFISLILVAATANSAWAAKTHRCLVTPDHVAEVGSQVTGVLSSIHAERGDPVRKGQLLAKLQAGVQRASVTVAATRANADADLKAAETRYRFQRQKLVRAEELVDANFISKQALDEIQAEANVAKQQYIQAREQHRIAKRELELAQARLKMRDIRSPFNGIVAERYFTIGERVEERPVFRIARVDPLRVEIIVPAELFGTVKKGMTARVTPELPDATALQAEVVLVDKLIDPASNTFRVRAELPNANSELPSGLRCRASLHEGEVSVKAKRKPSTKSQKKKSVKAKPATLQIDSHLSKPEPRNSAKVENP